MEHDLKDSELRYRCLFEAAQNGILILDAKTGMITNVNPFLVHRRTNGLNVPTKCYTQPNKVAEIKWLRNKIMHPR
jgi:hypothetical protein